MKCELCNQTATEKHHVSYFPERTVGVCGFHGDEIHRRPNSYQNLLKYKNGDAQVFYSQKKRVDGFLFKMARDRRMLRH